MPSDGYTGCSSGTLPAQAQQLGRLLQRPGREQPPLLDFPTDFTQLADRLLRDARTCATTCTTARSAPATPG